MAQESEEYPAAIPLQRVVGLLTEAMDLIDAQIDCPEAAAHLDLALRRLRELPTGSSTRDADPHQLD